jgi:hypothetical protein
MAAARFAGWRHEFLPYLGFRLRLHPRLYAAARIRGLRTRQNEGKDKYFKFSCGRR